METPPQLGSNAGAGVEGARFQGWEGGMVLVKGRTILWRDGDVQKQPFTDLLLDWGLAVWSAC